MKYLLIVAALLNSITAAGQQWKKLYVASTGDTVKPGYFVKLVPGRSYSCLEPKATEAYEFQMIAKRKAFIERYGQDKLIEIDRLSRLRRGKQYTAIAVLKIYDYHLDNFNQVEFFVNLEDGLTNGEIEIVRP